MKRRKASSLGRFAGIPHSVLNTPEYIKCPASAKALLIELVMQYNGHNNGKLMATLKLLKKRGWNSQHTISRAVKSLMNAKLVKCTRLGRCPNIAAWYAITWRSIDHMGDLLPPE